MPTYLEVTVKLHNRELYLLTAQVDNMYMCHMNVGELKLYRTLTEWV